MGDNTDARSCLPLTNHDGCTFPWLPDDDASLSAHLKEVRNMTIRNNDVLVIGYPLSGCRHALNIVTSLLSNKYGVHVANDHVLSFDTTSPEELSHVTSPRILHSHYPFRFLPHQVSVQRPKIIYLLRNPKDVCVSLYRHCSRDLVAGASFEDFFHSFLNGETGYKGWFEHVLQYQEEFRKRSELHMLTLRYEDIVRDPLRHAKSLAKFLEVDIDASEVEDLVDTCCFDLSEPRHKRMKVDSTSGRHKCDTFYSKDDVGEWKNCLTVGQDEEFDDVIDQRLAGSGNEFIYSL